MVRCVRGQRDNKIPFRVFDGDSRSILNFRGFAFACNRMNASISPSYRCEHVQHPQKYVLSRGKFNYLTILIEMGDASASRSKAYRSGSIVSVFAPLGICCSLS